MKPLLISALALHAALAASAAEPALLSGLRPAHPRLFLEPGAVTNLRARCAADPLIGAWRAALKKDAEAMLAQPVSIYEKPDGKRLLSVSRRVLDRVQTLGLARLLEDDPRYAERAWRELDAVCGFADWNPAHFLDTAEMTRAVATGYDWLYGDWTPVQRARLEQAILHLGLQPAIEAMDKSAWWVTCDHNWNQVCHGGIGLGALAVADRFPAEATRVLESARVHLPRALHAYEPDGGGIEGPGYWSYGCGFQVALVDGLRTALDTDLGLAPPVLGASGFYPIYMSGARRIAFEFSDCGSHEVSAETHWWLAARYREPAFAWFRRERLAKHPDEAKAMDLLWAASAPAAFDPAALPLDRHFRHAECASLRSSWTDPDALVVAIQGGDTSFNHSHLDRGSFILEAQGVRWIADLGVEPQTYQAHRHHLSRWLFYRLRAEGHNTLVLNPASFTNGPDQSIKGRAPFTAFTSQPDGAHAELDMASAYTGLAQVVHRTFDLVDHRGALVVSDHVEPTAPADLWWFAHTPAAVEVAPDGRSAVLSRSGKKLRATLEKPADARLGVMDAKPLPSSPNPDIQAANKDYRKLFIHLPAAGTVDLRVRFEPLPAR